MILFNKKKKITKGRFIKGIHGSISILLCLLLTPFISVSLGLVEYARYQQVLEVTDEIYELTGISVLSDYDKYMHNRFGLLSTTQENSFGSGADSLFQENAKILGNQITMDAPSMTGKFSLANTEVLRRQIVDFSELTSTTAVLAKDFNLEELLEKLQGVSQFQDVMNTVDSLADLADALSDAVDALENLKTSVTNLQNAVNSAVSSANTLAQDMANLFQKLGDNGITLPESASLEEIEAALGTFCEEYLDDFKSLYATAKSLVDNLNNIKTYLDSVKSSADAFISAVNKAKEAADRITATNSADSNGAISAAATTSLKDVLEKMTSLVEDALTDMKQETINTAKDAVNNIIDNAIESTGLAGFTDRYAEIISGNYFSLPLSDTAQQDLIDLLKYAGKLYAAQDPNNIASGLLSFLKSKLVPNLHINVDLILDTIEITLQAALNTLKKGGEKVASLLTELVKIVKELFDLDLFYKSDLNAFVDIGDESKNPYKDFLKATGSLFSAIEKFTNSLKGLNLFGILGSIAQMFGAIGKMLQAIFNIAGDAVNSITKLGDSIISGDVKKLYEKLLISGYMRHNLPSRVNSSSPSFGYDNGSFTSKISLEGKGLTGFAYDDIARPTTYYGQSSTENGFQGMYQLIENLKKGSGTDTMFKGAELEYIRAGTNSEIANQVIVFLDLYFLRLLLDLPSVFMDAEVGAVAAAANIASWVVYILYIVAEPFCDTLILVNGQKVPLIRTDCWLTATGIGSFITKISEAVVGKELKSEIEKFTQKYINNHSGSGGSGVMERDYPSHVLILLLLFVDSDTQISRLQSLIELETAEYYRQQGKSFDINQTYTTVEIAADVTFHPFFNLGALTDGSSLLPRKRIKQTVSY